MTLKEYQTILDKEKLSRYDKMVFISYLKAKFPRINVTQTATILDVNISNVSKINADIQSDKLYSDPTFLGKMEMIKQLESDCILEKLLIQSGYENKQNRISRLKETNKSINSHKNKRCAK